MTTLEELLEFRRQELKRSFKPGFLQREHTVFQFRFSEPGSEPFHLTVSTTDFDLSPGEHEAPTLTLFVENHSTCWDLILGRMDGMQAFMEGRYRADSHIVLSQLLLYLFKSNDPTNIYQVQD